MATALAYAPTLRNGFVDFDDQTNLIENPFFRGFGGAELWWMFTNLEGHFIPLTWLSFAFDHALWGMNPVGYHLTNAILHVANAIVFYALSVRLLRLAFGFRAEAPPSLFMAAAISAAAFALHPLRVESVAWATERRDVLSGLFFLLALNSYLRFHERRSGIAWAALAWYVPSLLAKAVGMSLPVVLLVLDAYPLRRLPARLRDWWRPEVRTVWLEKLPFVALAVVALAVEAVAERTIGTFYSLAEHGIPGRIGQAFYALAFYLVKTVLPVGLSPLYQLPVGWRFARPDVFVAALVVVGITVACYAVRARRPWALAAWVAYVALVAPFLGLAHVGPQIAADRYTYLGTLGWAVLAGGAVLALDLGARPGRARHGVVAAAALAALALGVLTWRQIGVWHDSVTLWRAAVAADPNCYICLNNLGNAFVRDGRGAEGEPYFAAAMRIQPEDADAHANLGMVAMQAGRNADARREYERALALDPRHAVAHTNVARLLIDDGDAEDAIPHLEAALREEPNMAEARTNLGLALMARGDLAAAERELRRAVVLQPDLAVARNNLGTVVLRAGRGEEAAAEFRRAVDLDPSAPAARYNLGLALEALDRPDEAITSVREAVRLRPAYASAQQKLIELLASNGRDEEARAQVAEAERDAPDSKPAVALALAYIEAHRTGDAIALLRTLVAGRPDDMDVASLLAWLLSTAEDDALRDGAAAVALAERAVAAEAEAADADSLDTLAAAYAEVGRFADAVATARRARAAAEDDSDLAREIEARLAAYEQGRAYRTQ